MNVLTIREPFASLILYKKKRIETRSFRTHYRGEIYIHASSGYFKKRLECWDELLELIRDMEVFPGYIFCKAYLKDCIYMTQEYIEDMKKNHYQEYICGHYEVGRYAWVLSDIEPLDKKIFAKGRLGIWNYDEGNR